MAGYRFLKRKGLDHLTDDFSDFPLSSPATKIRRLDAELPPIAEVEAEQDEPLAMPTLPIVAAEAPNEERALVLFKPLVHSFSPFSLTLNSDLLSEIKSNQAPWSKQRDSDCDLLLRSAAEREEEEEKRNRGMALVPWVPSTSPASQLGPILHQDSNNNNIAELMEEADQMGAEAEADASVMMDIEQQQDATSNSSVDPTPPSMLGAIGGIEAAAAAATSAPEGLHQWQQQQQQHCLLPHLPQNISTPITWTR